jgi:DNA-binding NtrC family response regulator
VPGPHVLIADDQTDVLQALRLLLKGEGFQTTTAGSPAQILSHVENGQFDALLMDMNYSRDTTSGREGLTLLGQVRELDPALPVIVMTAWGSVDNAVEAMNLGARDYITKPWENDRLLLTLRNHVELGRALRDTERLEQENQLLRRRGAPPMIAAAPAMQPVLELIERIGPSDANVLVTGEHGTGKEVVANWIHAASRRADHSIVTVNAGGLSDGVFESELFGHVKGAFTDAKANRVGCFELAHEGTLFLDEIGNMPLAQQAKVLRVLQTGELHRVGSSKVHHVDVRLVTATNADLHAAVTAGAFREDLLYRINTVEIRLPPLRDRVEDIPALAAHFLEQTRRRYGREIEGFSPAALDALREHRWPGNVRELQHVVERALLMSRGSRIDVDDLGLRPVTMPAPDGEATEKSLDGLDRLTLDEAEKRLIERALARCDGNVSAAAEHLGVSRSALYRRLQRHGINAGE